MSNGNGGEPERPSWARWVTIGALAVALVALGWTLYSVGLHELLHRLELIGPWFLVVIGIEIGVTGCDAAAIYAFLRPDQRKIGYLRVLLAQLSGRAVNAVTPMGSLGEVVKVTMILERVPQARTVSAVLLYNMTGLGISFLLIAVGAPITAFALDLPRELEILLYAGGGVAAISVVVMPILVQRGMLSSIAGLGHRIGLIRKKQYKRWRGKLEQIDSKLRDAGGARRHDRLLAVTFVLVSHVLSWTASAVLIYAAGGRLSLGFLAAVLTAGQVIGWVAALVPLGLGISESGNYALFSALGHEPAIGVTLSLGRRVTQLVYAAIGLVLAAVNQTVKEAKAARKTRRRR